MKAAALLIPFLIFSFPTFAQTSTTMTIKVFFHNEKMNPGMEDCNKVFPVTRSIPKTKAVARAALEELFKGVTTEEAAKEYWSFPAEDTKGVLKSVNVKNGAAYVNFNRVATEKLGNATTSCGQGFFAMIDETLYQFPTIKKVFYAIEGDPREFYNWVQVGECPKELKNCSGKNFLP